MFVHYSAVQGGGFRELAEGQKVEFRPIELKSGDLQTYRLRVYAKQPGRYRLHAVVSVAAMLRPLSQDAMEIEVGN